MKMKLKENEVVSCKTLKQAKNLLKYLSDHGITWKNGKTLDNIEYESEPYGLCYYLLMEGCLVYTSDLLKLPQEREIIPFKTLNARIQYKNHENPKKPGRKRLSEEQKKEGRTLYYDSKSWEHFEKIAQKRNFKSYQQMFEFDYLKTKKEEKNGN